MSFWFYGRDNSGRVKVSSVTPPLMESLILVGLLLGLFFGTYLQARSGRIPSWPIYVTAAGLFLFLCAKITQFGKGTLTFWGTRGMTSKAKALYVTGYGLMLIGVLFMLVVRKAVM